MNWIFFVLTTYQYKFIKIILSKNKPALRLDNLHMCPIRKKKYSYTFLYPEGFIYRYINDQRSELSRVSHVGLSVRLYIRELIPQCLRYRFAPACFSIRSCSFLGIADITVAYGCHTNWTNHNKCPCEGFQQFIRWCQQASWLIRFNSDFVLRTYRNVNL